MRRPTQDRPFVVERRGDRWYCYYSDDCLGAFPHGPYERGNVAMSDLRWFFISAWEWLCGAWAYLRGHPL
jgi:hypothetical protein